MKNKLISMLMTISLIMSLIYFPINAIDTVSGYTSSGVYCYGSCSCYQYTCSASTSVTVPSTCNDFQYYEYVTATVTYYGGPDSEYNTMHTVLNGTSSMYGTRANVSGNYQYGMVDICAHHSVVTMNGNTWSGVTWEWYE